MTDTQQTVFTIIANVLGVETSDIAFDDDFTLDLNATPTDMQKIKDQLETALEITLPDEDEENPLTTVGSLMEVVEDSLL